MEDGFLRRRYKRFFYDFPLRMLCEDIFDRFSYRHRKSIPEVAQKYIDFVLWLEKQFATHENHNKWKSKDIPYMKKELRAARLVVKAHNGLVFVNDIFRDMYKDIRFIAVVRNGYAVCEGRMRRGWRIEEAARFYKAVGDEIARNSDKDDYLIVQFEEILAKPLEMIAHIYKHFDLNLNECSLFRLQHKPIAAKGTKGSVLYGDYDRQLAWFTRTELKYFFKPDVNTIQIERLSADDRQFLKNSIEETMIKLGYDEF